MKYSLKTRDLLQVFMHAAIHKVPDSDTMYTMKKYVYLSAINNRGYTTACDTST